MKTLPELVAFSGLAGCGKTTAAAHLRWRFGYDPYSFADPLREMLGALGVSEQQTREEKNLPVPHLGGKTPRELLQSLGTEWGRDLVATNIWLNVAEHRVNELYRLGARYVVIDDCRFENEAQWVRDQGGLVVHITRPALSPMGHRSEVGIQTHATDLTIANDTTVALFLAALEASLST